MVELVRPSIEHEDKYKEMIKEWQKYGGSYVPCIIDYDCNNPIEELDYNAVLKVVDVYSKGNVFDYDVDYFESSDFYFIFDDDLIGMGEIRHNLKPLGIKTIGHIACGIRPSKRKQGYALKSVKCMLEKLKEDHIDEVIVCHYSENSITPKLIEKLGFEYRNSVISEVSKKEIRCYTKKIADKSMIITKDILDEEVPIEMVPTRLDSAMNLYTNVNYNGKLGIIVYNTNPDVWNCLYSFYEVNHKFTVDNYNFDSENLTYRKLVMEYQKVYEEIYEKEKGNTKDVRINTLMDEYKRTFGLSDVHINDELLPIFELKYSKSKNVWTLYYFENYVADSVEKLDDLLNQKLYEQKILPLDSSIKEIEGVEVASNIPYLLSIQSNVEKLNHNLIEGKN